MIHHIENWLTIDFEEFCHRMNEVPSKHFFPKPNEMYFSVFIDGNEYSFIDEQLSTIKIYNFKRLKKIARGIKLYKSLNKNLIFLTKEKIKWEIFQKYSYEHNIVIKTGNYIFYEFRFHHSGFVLDYLRISNREE